jgi:NDP-sugar pyrophosphorylase family protein
MLRMEDVTVALLAGGLATRLRPVTESIPKALVEVAGRPFIDHQLALLQGHGVRHVVLCLGHLGEQVQEHLGDGRRYGLSVDYSLDGEVLRGTGGALRKALPKLSDPAWIMYGDSYMEIPYSAVLAHFDSSSALGLMTVIRNENQWDKSNVVFADGVLKRYNKRLPTPEMRYIDYGVSLLRQQAIRRIIPDRPCDLADLYSELVSRKEMIGYEVFSRFYEIGSPSSLAEARAHLAGKLKAG